MNLAIIIGVAEYKDKRNNLPGCANDTAAIHNTITKTEKFDSTLILNANEESAKVKDELTNFVSVNKGQKIDEIFFYYTGHGEFYNNEFYYLLSDFDPSKRKQTSLQNMEIDTLLKTLSPKLVIKVIDACQSGTSYIKESDAIAKYFDSSKQTFNKCYFLNSSLNTQSSFQNDEMSFFTKSFIDSIQLHKTDEIRYKDIIDFISDEFENNGDQTPFFVIQAELTERFCTIKPQLREYLKSLSAKPAPAPSASKAPNIADMVKSEAKEFSTKEEAITLLETIRSVVSQLELAPELNELYELKVSVIEEIKNVPSRITIGKWLKENPNAFFAKPTHTRVYDDPNEVFSALSNQIRLRSQVQEEKPAKYELDGYDLKIDVPFKGLSIIANSKYPNINSYNLVIVFLLSKKAIRFFYFHASYIEESWDNRKLNYKEIEWKTVEFKITDKDSVIEGVKAIFTELNSRITKDLTDRFKVK
ncbi:caspase family protein [Chitinophagaceae bacterium LB-8]|uniref:Caspase family protein n=1 Tax=Paraflavisolibacter caeni TaxID=2982496 RepID=A0A9X3B6J8_9BACT|nr:caspase family protein [Paraflavisolibacter caeni]MCU7548135.1 caspase family protein [Paraflavisolibacter caeni]